MTETPDKRMLIINDELWDKVTRRAFNEKANGDKGASYSSIVRDALTEYFNNRKDTRND